MSGPFNNQIPGATINGPQGFSGGGFFAGTLPVGGAFRLYNVGDDLSTNFERLNIDWSANVLRIQTQAGGTGVLRSIIYNAANHTWQLAGGQVMRTGNDGTVSGLFVVGVVTTASYTVATLPVAANWQYGRAIVTDATAPTFGAIVAGGGAVKTPVWSDGVNWMVG